ncbi:Protein kinase-like domain [Pseudocohnilembus persalinus]|uniref:Protein kinase-like domain n=1 Tax=Pseudocohnilembus persalinus TaxID=266149 RepID=A0A0V0R1N2_PSEPJ|nr:Protein kinase-like domain [Pseudocohnilembus persalinus]|eukprot:KRX08414.1 Protein kinase-like domain [Pseudocohnilembus persalinus]
MEIEEQKSNFNFDANKSRVGNYYIIRLLDSGAQGKVKLVQHAQNKKYFAMKIYTELGQQALDDMQKEVQALQLINNHENVLKMVEFIYDGEYVKAKNKGSYKVTAVVLELAPNGCLFDYVKVMQGFHIDIARYYFRKLLSGLKYMHEKGLVHRDIKLENLLLSENYTLKIADFGFVGASNQILYENLGTKTYKAPEIHTYSKQGYQGEPTDVFSAGVCFFIICCGHYPFNQAIPQDKLYNAQQQKNQSYWQYQIKSLTQKKIKTDFVNENFIKLMNGIFTSNPNERYTIDQVLESEFMQAPGVDINQDIISFNLNMSKEQVEKSRLQELKEKVQQNNQNGSDNHQARAVPENLQGEINNIREGFQKQLPAIPQFQEAEILGLENSSTQMALKKDELYPVIIYILKNMKIEGYQLDEERIKIKLEKSQLCAFFNNDEAEELAVKIQVGFNKQTDQQQNLQIFNICFARKSGDYVNFRNLFDQFVALSEQFQ